MLLFFLRHGDPIYDPDSLTPLGQRQAEALGKRLAQFGLDKIYVFSSQRAIQTAQPTCEMLKIQPEILDWCNEGHAWRELACPDATGKTRWLFHQPDMIEQMVSEDVRAMDMEWYRHPKFAGQDFGAGIERIRRETDQWLAQLGYRHDSQKKMYDSAGVNSQRVALFAHQGFGLAFLSCLLDIPYPQFTTHFDMGHTGMTVIHFPEQQGWVVPKILQLSNDSHLYREGLPTCYQNLYRF